MSEALVGVRGCVFTLQIVNLAEAPYRSRLILAEASMRVVEMWGEDNYKQE